jgi:hypothetical protein
MSTTFFSQTYFGKTEAFELQVARGQVVGHETVNIQGYNSSMPTSFRAPWELADSVAYVFPSAAVAMTFSSGSAETVTMTVVGLDANYLLKTATVTFTASTTGVVTSGTSTFYRINRMVITSGTSVGNITAANGGTTYARINAGAGTSQAAIYTVPAGNTFYLQRAYALTHNNGNQNCTYRVYSQTVVNGVTTPTIVLTAPFVGSYNSLRVVPRAYVEKTDIQWQLNQSTAAPGSVQIEGTLIRNPE